MTRRDCCFACERPDIVAIHEAGHFSMSDVFALSVRLEGAAFTRWPRSAARLPLCVGRRSSRKGFTMTDCTCFACLPPGTHRLPVFAVPGLAAQPATLPVCERWQPDTAAVL